MHVRYNLMKHVNLVVLSGFIARERNRSSQSVCAFTNKHPSRILRLPWRSLSRDYTPALKSKKRF